jgi:N-acetylmuramoyl-L-alanine amidase
MGYLTNSDDYAYLATKAAKEEMADAISDAIITYFKALDGDSSATEESAAEDANEVEEKTEAQPTESEEITEGYTIQLISSIKEVDTNDYQFKQYKGRVRLVMGTGKFKYKYCFGSYKTSADAQADLKEVRKTFKDAFVVRFRDGAIVTK